jgi:hypothetical protein
LPGGGPERGEQHEGAATFDDAAEERETGAASASTTPKPSSSRDNPDRSVPASPDALVTLATMTMDTYGHLFENRLDEVADAMDAALSVARKARESALTSDGAVASAGSGVAPGRSDRPGRGPGQR